MATDAPSFPLAALAIAGCPMFPADNHWNQRVDRLPVHPDSGAMMQAIGLDRTVHPDFGSGRYEGGRIGIPYTTVPRGGRSRRPLRVRRRVRPPARTRSR